MQRSIRESYDSEQLGFPEAVQRAFGFLNSEYGFQVVEASPMLVRYETPTVFLEVGLEPLSFELWIDCGLLAETALSRRYPATLEEILAVAGVSDAPRKSFFQASTPERIAHVLPRLAAVVRRYGRDTLAGSPAVFEEVDALRALRHAELERNRVRQSAERCWHEQDYPGVCQWYSRIQDQLMPVEIARLKYAQGRTRPE